jgi:hypothetical protein
VPFGRRFYDCSWLWSSRVCAHRVKTINVRFVIVLLDYFSRLLLGRMSVFLVKRVFNGVVPMHTVLMM